jgi:hypothetical protein
VTVQIGNGLQGKFWSDGWLHGEAIESSCPGLVLAVPKRVRKLRTVCQALQSNQWIRDISGALSVRALQQFIWLWERVQGMTLLLNTPDRFIWRWSPSQQYSALFAYRAFFHGQCSLLVAKELAKTPVPPRCKFFLWLALLDRC